jgi:hypothetical protein
LTHRLLPSDPTPGIQISKYTASVAEQLPAGLLEKRLAVADRLTTQPTPRGNKLADSFAISVTAAVCTDL